MNKKIKIILIGIIILIIGYYPAIIFYDLENSHNSSWSTYKQYLWIFKDSIKGGIVMPAFSATKEDDIFTQFNYNENYYISIWEFKDLSLLNLKNTPINLNVALSDVEFKSYEILNAHENPEIDAKYNLAFSDKMQVNLSVGTSVIKNIESANYKGFYGIIKRMTFSNGKNENLILFDYKKPVPTLFLLYKTPKSFYVIMVESNEPFDPNIIKIFNLK